MYGVAAALHGANRIAAQSDRPWFAFEDACAWLGKDRQAVARLLGNMAAVGVVDRVCEGRYLLRPPDLLGIPAWAEDPALAVATAFSGMPHRMSGLSALNLHRALQHPLRSFHVATVAPVPWPELSGWPLVHDVESPRTIGICAEPCRGAMVSCLERALLEAAKDLGVARGAHNLAFSMFLRAPEVDPRKLARCAEELGWSDALRRIGSMVDSLGMKRLAGKFSPPSAAASLIRLDPSERDNVWTDDAWGVIWHMPLREMQEVLEH